VIARIFFTSVYTVFYQKGTLFVSFITQSNGDQFA